MPHPRSTYSKSNLILPSEDPRINVKGSEVERRKSWVEIQQTNPDVLKIYQIVISRLLSRIDGIHLDTLRHLLRVQFIFDSKTIEKFVSFITNNECKHIEWEIESGCRRPILFLAPRSIKPSIVGTHSKWSPHLKTQI